jgi:hypothetical protein
MEFDMIGKNCDRRKKEWKPQLHYTTLKYKSNGNYITKPDGFWQQNKMTIMLSSILERFYHTSIETNYRTIILIL